MSPVADLISPSSRGVKYCDLRVCLSVDLFVWFVCLLAYYSRKPLVQISLDLLYMLRPWPWPGPTLAAM